MRLRLQELQAENQQARKLRADQQPGQQGWEDIDGVLHYQGLLYIPKLIRTELISRHHDDPLAGHFGIEKTREFFSWKYYWPMLRNDVEDYVRECNVCLASKVVWHKPYGDLQSLPVSIYCWKDLLIDFVTGLPISMDWKKDSYNSILIIVNRLMKIIYYMPVKVTINAPSLAKVIIGVVVQHHRLPDSIVTDRESLFTLRFWSLLCYFLGIKRRLLTAFYLQTNGQTKRQNSTMEAYLSVFVNFEQNHWARLLLMAEFAYNNAKNASTGYTSFKLNCGYHLWVSYKEDLNPHSQLRTAEELSSELQKLMTIC